ncbi:MAG: DUF2336 domain-containing protein [Rhizobiaceae bacterium]|nr:DUF2336 domain-containing protein [Rhizobiaceae bacterium]
MIVSQFLNWIDTAKVAERAAAASALARAYLRDDLDFEDRCAAEAALTMLLDDPSPKVRLAIAEALALSHRAPQQIILALAGDQPAIAATVLALSPVLSDSDLIDRVASGEGAIQRHIASRPVISMPVSAAIAEVGEAEAIIELVRNSGATIAALSFRRMAERFGQDGEVREALLADRRLPSDSRHHLLMQVGEALKDSPFVVALIGAARAAKLTRDACVRASITLIDGTESAEYGALVEHLRMRGELTTSFIMRTVAVGKIDFFGATLVAISGQTTQRVRALLAGGRDAALAALFRASGLPAYADKAILTALTVWREVANGKRVAGAQEVTWLMLRSINATPGQSGPTPERRELASLLKSIHLEELRANARGHALAIAAA